MVSMARALGQRTFALETIARRLTRIGISLLIVAAIAAFYFFIFTRANSTTIALTFLLATLGIATRWGLVEGIVTSVAGVMSFNFFFLPPLFTFYLADTQNWVALFAFLTTAVVASHLSASARRRALEATREREQVERLYKLSRALMLLDKDAPVGSQIAHRIAQVFETAGVSVFDREKDEIYAAGSIEDLGTRLRSAAFDSTAYYEPDRKVSILPVSLGADPVGSLAICGTAISDTAVQAIGNVAAVTIERARTEAAASRIEAARQNDAMKAMLLDALAHEFKTPLTSIKAAASSILEEGGPEQNELRAVIEEEVDRLDSLVTDTIQMARIEAGELKLHIQPYPVADLIAAALGKLKVLVEEREITIEVSPNLPRVLADAGLTSLTIRQLVTNALQYAGPESPIEIRSSLSQDGLVRISVKDQGPGIPAREQSRIFERYYRMPETAARVPGTGLGLNIARNIVQAHGGVLWVESEPGHGCEFSFTLPVSEAQ
jgi:two-component system sensor histidine kinase KdpD